MSISNRIRPGIEAAPWVIEEIKMLEAALSSTREETRNETLNEASDAAHDAIHSAIWSIDQCQDVKDAVADAILSLKSPAPTPPDNFGASSITPEHKAAQAAKNQQARQELDATPPEQREDAKTSNERSAAVPNGIYDSRTIQRREWWDGGSIVWWSSAQEISAQRERGYTNDVPPFGTYPDVPTPSQPSSVATDADDRRLHVKAVGIVHDEAMRTLSRDDYDMCIRIAKRALLSRPSTERDSVEREAKKRMLQAYPTLSQFFEKHGIGSITKTSCFKCGHVGEPAITHLELPNIYICKCCASLSADAADRVDAKGGAA